MRIQELVLGVLLTTATCVIADNLPTAPATVGAIVNARIHTLTGEQPSAEALAWDATGRIVAVGSKNAVLAQAAGATVHDAGGATVVPGLIDAHAHLMGLGFALLRADLVGTRSKAEVIERLQAFAATLPEGTWLLGRGWDQNDWPETAFPTAADLDAAFPTRPVWLERVDGHAGWANTAAMRRVGRDLGGDWQPDGGLIVRAGGQPTGVFVDAAARLVDDIVPPPDETLRTEALRRALAASASVGLTGVHDMGTSVADLDLYQRFADEDRLTLRVVAYADGDAAALERLCKSGPYRHRGGRVRMAGVKFYADGALGSRGAALKAPYSDDHGNHGLLVTPPEQLLEGMRKARRCRVQVATHAIGDRANRLVLDDYATVLGDAASTDHRWRVEHAQIVSVDDIPMFEQLRVIASMQPTHATSDMPWAEARVGRERLAGAYAWRRFRQANVRLALGSDFPVESLDPRLGLYAAVTRQDLDGQPPGGWLPDQKLTPAEALRGFTADAAWAGYMEDEVGGLAPGLRADFVLLDTDPLTAPSSELPTIKVLSTWVDGRRVYEAPVRPGDSK
ncbi:MAG: amidohydrolase [Steroidobacteraceae bacterium]|nr:amidohydrolase [Steroidobacteraceae bacterium]